MSCTQTYARDGDCSDLLIKLDSRVSAGNSKSDWLQIKEIKMWDNNKRQSVVLKKEITSKRSLAFDAVKFLKRHKKLPSVASMRGYLAGWFDEKFRQKRRRVTGKESSSEIKIEILDQPSITEVEILEDNQLVLRQKLLAVLGELNMEQAFINDEFKEKLEPFNHHLEVTADWSKPKKLIPT